MSKFIEITAFDGEVTTYFHANEKGQITRAYRLAAVAPKSWECRGRSMFADAPGSRVKSLWKCARRFVSDEDIALYETTTGRSWKDSTTTQQRHV